MDLYSTSIEPQDDAVSGALHNMKNTRYRSPSSEHFQPTKVTGKLSMIIGKFGAWFGNGEMAN